MTIKQVFTKISGEAFDTKNLDAFVVVEGQRFEIEDVNLYDDEVHFTVGPPAEEL